MDDLTLFPVPDREFADPPAFRSYLAEHLHPSQVESRLLLVVGLTKRSPADFLAALEAQGFRIKQAYGAVKKLECTDESTRLEFYLTQETDSGVVVCYTNFRKTEEVPRITGFLETDEHSYPLFFRPYVMQEILDNLASDYPECRVTDFTARRYPGSRTVAKLRPEVAKTFSYWGLDGRETLQELEFNYGVLPTRMVVQIPGVVKLGIDGHGILTHHYGSLGLVLEILGRAVDESARAMQAFDGSSFQVFPVRTAERTFEIASSRPVHMQLQRRLDVTDVRAIEAGLDEKGYGIIRLAAQEGSLYLDAEVVSRNGQRFRFKAADESVRMLPEGPPHLSTFMEFYSFVLEHVDPGAELVA